MRVEDCIFTVERRSLGGCLDLAATFMRRFIVPIIRLQLLFAIPSCALVWYLATQRTDMLFLSLIVFSGFCALYSGALIAGIGPQVFGVPISTRNALKKLFNRIAGYGFLAAAIRTAQWLGSICFYLPSLLLTAFVGHTAEVVLLEQTSVSETPKRLSVLCRGGAFGRNFGRLLLLMFLWALTALGVFILLDGLLTALFNMPVLLFRLDPGPDMSAAFVNLLQDDPLTLTVLQASLWLPFPLLRLAWFFCYLDTRIRNEGWDLEVQFRAEAVRLGESA